MKPTILPITDDTTVILSPYFLFYQIEQTRIPLLEDYAELSAFTANYLNSYFFSIFSGTETIFVNSTTNITGSEFRLGEPVRVDFNTTIVFAFPSTMIPDKDELDARLAGVFEGTNGEAYAAQVASGVAPSNIFSTTTAVSFQVAPDVASDNATARITIIAVVSTLAVFALSAAVVLYRRQEYELIGKASILTENSSTDGESHNDENYTVDSRAISLSKYRYNGEKAMRQSSAPWKGIVDKNVASTSGVREASLEYKGCAIKDNNRVNFDEMEPKTPSGKHQNLEDVNI
jgi:hypothetical protein